MNQMDGITTRDSALESGIHNNYILNRVSLHVTQPWTV